VNGQGKTATRYRDQILTANLREFQQHVGENFFLIDDNACPDRAVLVDDFLTGTIALLDWAVR